MNEHPILFTPDNIRLIREERKWQTRRIIKPQPDSVHDGEPYWNIGGYRAWKFRGISDVLRMGTANPLKCPYGQVGDKLYIKEGVIVHKDGKTLAGYYMDGARVTNLGEKRLTAMFMPKLFARRWLEITEVRIERVQDIIEEDAIAEGISTSGRAFTFNGGLHLSRTAKDSFAALWDSINKYKHPFENNDWVWCLSFKLIN